MPKNIHSVSQILLFLWQHIPQIKISFILNTTIECISQKVGNALMLEVSIDVEYSYMFYSYTRWSYVKIGIY